MPPNQQWFCRLLVFFVYSAFLSSSYILITMTFERVYSIIRPHKAASFNTVKRAKITIPCIFLLAFSYSIPNLFVTGYNGPYCIINAVDSVFGQLYYWVSEIVAIPVPFVSLLSMNSVIIHTLRQRSRINFTRSVVQGQNEGHHSKHKQSETQVYILLLLVSFGFLMLSIPIDVLFLYMNFYIGSTPYYYASLHLFQQIAEKMYYTNHGFNFFLYVVSGKKFRTDLKNLFTSNNLHGNKNTSLTLTTSTIIYSVPLED